MMLRGLCALYLIKLCYCKDTAFFCFLLMDRLTIMSDISARKVRRFLAEPLSTILGVLVVP